MRPHRICLASSLVVFVSGMAVLLMGLPIFGAALTGMGPAGISAPSGYDAKGVHTLTNYNPYFAQNLPLYVQATTDVAVNLSIKVGDFNNDTVNVTWEWGDGSANATNTTDPAEVPQWVNQTHTWSVAPQPGAGDYYAVFNLNITLDDGMGGTAKTLRYVNVYVPPNGVPTVDLSAPSKVDPSDNVTVVGNASDPEGDPLTWTFVFNNSVTDIYTVVFHTPASAPDEVVWQNVSYTFGTEGIFTVRLNVSDALPPFDVWPHNMSIVVMISVVNNSIPLVSHISVNPSSPVINSTLGYVVVDFVISVYDIDGDILTATWDFGDGSPIVNVSAGGQTVYEFIQSRNYTDAGYYNVTVNVSDGRQGHYVIEYRVLYVASTNLPPALVGLTWSSVSGNATYVGAVISFTAVITDPEEDPIELVWNFSDGGPLVYVNLTDYVMGNVTSIVNHTFSVADTYHVSVEFTDNKIGLFDHNKTGYIDIDVVPDDVPPVAEAGEDQSVSAGSLVQLNATGSYDNVGIVNYTWSLVYDGSDVTLYGPEPSFLFLNEGVYQVTLNVTDAAGNNATDTVTITVGPAIPEFSSVMVPVVFLLVILVFLIGRRRPSMKDPLIPRSGI